MPLAALSDVVGAYDGLARGWEMGAENVYRPLAAALVATSPIPLAGRLVLDVGSGTGAVARAATDRGARVMATDLNVTMLNDTTGRAWPAAAADVLTLPFCDRTFEGVLAGFLLNQLPPGPALAELTRVVGPGGVVLASTWAADGCDPVKDGIDGVLAAWGWTPPAWYQQMKQQVLPVSGSARRLAEAAEAAGLVDVKAFVRREDLGLREPAEAVSYRLNLPHTARWVAGLDDRSRTEITRQALAAIRRHVGQWRPAVIFLVGRVPQDPSPGRRAADRSRPAA